MRGLLPTEREAALWNRLLAHPQWRTWVAMGVMGLLAGLFVSNVRLHLGLPGHKALFWMTPIVMARLVTRCPGGVTTGLLAAACTSLATGGRFAGGVAFLPAVGLAGIVLDWLANVVERHRLVMRYAVVLFGLGGALANLLCLFKRLAAPAGLSRHLLWLASGFWADLGSYLFFGFSAGLLGAALAYGIRRRWPPEWRQKESA